MKTQKQILETNQSQQIEKDPKWAPDEEVPFEIEEIDIDLYECECPSENCHKTDEYKMNGMMVTVRECAWCGKEHVDYDALASEDLFQAEKTSSWPESALRALGRFVEKIV